MTPRQVIKHYGTQTAAAKALGLTQPAICNWLKRGEIPELQQLRIQDETKGKLRASKRILPSTRKLSQV